MYIMKHFPIVLACSLLYASTVVAQSLQQETRPTVNGSQSVTIIIERQQLRFAAPASAQEVKLEIFNQAGEMVYDSGFLADSVIWQDFNGRIGIGTQRPGAALLTVAGQIETTSGGIKFPNGTVQTTSYDSRRLNRRKPQRQRN